MLETKNYNLKKPEGKDIVDINILNGNTDIIDGALTPSADPTQVPASNGPAKISQWVSWIVNRIKAITGKTNWYDAPDITLAQTKAHVSAAAPHTGHVLTSDVVTTATAGKILKLDANGKLPTSITGDAQTVDGKNASDFAPASQLTAHVSAAAPHTGHVLTSDVVTTAVAGKILKLDANGKLPTSITGDAQTVDGKNASDFATANHMAVKSVSISNGQVYTPIPDYTHHAYFVSLRSLQVSLPSTTVTLPTGSKITAGNYTVADVDLAQIECYINETDRTVHARGKLSNGNWIGGVANIMEIAWK